jgi:MFS family permease
MADLALGLIVYRCLAPARLGRDHPEASASRTENDHDRTAQVAGKLSKADRLLAEGADSAAVARPLEISEELLLTGSILRGRSGTGNAFPWRFVAPMLLGSSLNPVNSSLLATALVPIAAAMHVSVGRTAILISVLYLASSIAQPTAGKLSEEFGPRRVFSIGIVTVLAGGFVGGFARSMAGLIVARILIGIGSSAGYPSAMLLIRRRAESAGLETPPGNVLGGLVIAGLVTSAVGLPIGGALVGVLGWRAAFFVNVPLALVTLAMAAVWIPRDPPSGTRRSARDVATRIDLTGIAFFAGTLAGVLVFLMSLPRTDWIALAVAAVAGAGLLLWDLRADRPFLDVRLLANDRALTRTYVRWLILCICDYTLFYGGAEWMQAGRGLSALDTGLILLPMSAVSAAIAGLVSQKNLLRLPLAIAAVSCMAGAVGLLLLTRQTPTGIIVIVTLFFGVALGAGASANQTALYTQVDAGQIGTASGLFRTSGYVGSIASSGIIAVVFRTSVSDHGLHTIAIIMITVSFVAMVITLADRHLMAQRRAL